jgi:hypothetical protein
MHLYCSTAKSHCVYVIAHSVLYAMCTMNMYNVSHKVQAVLVVIEIHFVCGVCAQSSSCKRHYYINRAACSRCAAIVCTRMCYCHTYNSGIVGLYTALPLGDVLRQGGELEDVQSVLIDLIREGRRLLNSTYQVSNITV